MILKRFKKFLWATVVSLALISGGAVSANADTTGGLGGGGGGGGAYSGFEWVSVVAAKGDAYNQFVALGKWGSQTDSIVNARIGGNGVGVCKDSNVIWFIRSSQGGWTYNYTGATHGPNAGNVYGSIENPYSAYGNRRPIAAEINAFKDWDSGQNGRRIDNTPGYTIICSGKFMQPDRNWSSTSSTVTQDSTNTMSYNYPYSWTTSIDRQALAGDGGVDTIGAPNLHNQTSPAFKTAYGNLYDTLNTSAGAGLSVSDLTTKVRAALAIDDATSRPKVNLDAANKAGMAEGGVLNVSTHIKNATISTIEKIKVTRTTTCHYNQTWNSYWATYNATTSSCSSSDSTVTNRTSSKNPLGALELKGFWQMLSVHCNKAEFDALLASDPSLIEITTPDSTKSISGVVYTKNYTDPATIPFDLGNASNANPAKAKTGNLAFFDKECPFDCTPSSSTSSGASANNGATANVGSTGVVAPNLFGAKSNNTNSNAFEFFRDNANKLVKVDTWYPISDNGVSYAGEAPVTTTITRDPNGTPSLDGSGGGKFSMNSTKGDALFTGSSTTVGTQKNWDSSTFSGPTATILKGLHDSFNLKATWASDAGLPQAFNFKWEYAPTVKTTVPVTGVGFGTRATQDVGTKGEVSTTIQGKCYSFFGTNSGPSTVAQFGANTGTGTVNNLDKGLLTGGSSTIAKMTANFVRSTTE